MFKFIKGRKGYTLERAKIVKELFAFSRTVCHGFPHSPSCLAYDEELSLMCIGTKTGSVRVYGQPGVEFIGYHPTEGVVTQAHFITGRGRLVTLHENNELTLWEIVDTQLEQVSSITDFESRVFSICVTPSKSEILIGTEEGNIRFIDVETFTFTDFIVQKDLITDKVSADFKVSPGGVEGICFLNREQCVIGYQRGILVLFDLIKQCAKQTYITRKDLSSIQVIDDTKFVSCHTDGGYAVWNTFLGSFTKHVDQVYGPHACKPIDKLYALDNERTLVFSGGMPRSQYGDRYTVSVHRGPIQRVVFELTSKVVDFFVIPKKAVVILAEEELVAISLTDLKAIPLPYIFPLHCSAITNVIHAAAVPADIVRKLTDKISEKEWSLTEWPITGGRLPSPDVDRGASLKKKDENNYDLIITGHEDGSVRIYDATSVSMTLLACVRTSLVFNERCHEASRAPDQDEDEFLHFSKVGFFDPYSDDPRFAVKKLAFYSSTGTLVVGGTAGQVLVLGLERKSGIKVIPLDLVRERDNFVWKGHDALTYDADGDLKSTFYVQHVIQVSPPAGLTALAINEKWQALAAGTAHGFGCIDLAKDQVILFKCTLHEGDLGGAGAHSGDMVRRKSFKKSLRESFRRLRKGRSQRGKTTKNLDEVKPVERQVESRIMQDDGLSSMVRSLVFSEAYILSHAITAKSFWASTNSGSVFVYSLKRTGENSQASMSLCKEIHLKHHAPVLGVFVIDSHGYLCHETPPKESPVPNLWRVVICSEEQIKVFSLPQLKPLHKIKLTAHEGSRLRKLQVCRFTNSDRSEWCLVVMTNQGQVIVFSLPELRRIITADCCRKDDINGISSAVFTPLAEGFYLNSASELDRVSMSATKITAPVGILELPDESRISRKQSLQKKEEPKNKETVVKEVVRERRSATPDKRRSFTPERRAERRGGSSERRELKEAKEVLDKIKRDLLEADSERKVDTKETHEKTEERSFAVGKSDDGAGEMTVETAQLAERKVKKQVEQGDGFKMESVETVVTKKAVVVSEETRVINGADPDALARFESLEKEIRRIQDLESPNTDSGIGSVVEEVRSLEISSATDGEDSTIVIERTQEQKQNSCREEVVTVVESSKKLETETFNGNKFEADNDSKGFLKEVSSETKVTEKAEKNVKVIEQKTSLTQESRSSSHNQTSKKVTQQLSTPSAGNNARVNRSSRRRKGRN